jgi:hypothetical protein
MLFLSKYDLAKILIPSCLHDYNILKLNFMYFICLIESYSYYMLQLFLSPLEHSCSERFPDSHLIVTNWQVHIHKFSFCLNGMHL